MKKIRFSRVRCIATLFSLVIIIACSTKSTPPASYDSFSYHSKNGGIAFYYRDFDKKAIMHFIERDPKSKSEIIYNFPKCFSWGVCITSNEIEKVMPDLIEYDVPEVMVYPYIENHSEDFLAFKKLKTLNTLILTEFPIFDKALGYIKEISSLSSLYLATGSFVTFKALDVFQSQRPDMKIYFTKIDTTGLKPTEYKIIATHWKNGI